MQSRVSHPVPTAVTTRVAGVLAGESVVDRTVFLARLDRYWPDLVSGLAQAYGEAGADLAAVVVDRGARAFVQRPEALRLLDLKRHIEPDWFQAPSAVGYAAYADRFAGTLQGVIDRVPYLAELGVTYLHLMPLLKPRP